MSCLIDPIRARLYACFLSSNLGCKIPGVSTKYSSLLILIHVTERVTPGESLAVTTFFVAKIFIKVDLPVLGTPTIIPL